LSHQADLPALVLRRLAGALPLILGVTLISFLLTVHFGPDQTYALIGKNPTAAEVEQLRSELGYDQPFVVRYADYLKRLVTLDLGHAQATGESVRAMLARTIPISVLLVAPGFILGTLLALGLAALAAWHQGGALDRIISAVSVVGMSLSLVVILIGLQAVFGVWLGWFPVRGWAVSGPADYLHHVAVPTMAFVIATLGYNVRFFRAVLAAEMTSEQVRTARAFGVGPLRIMVVHVMGSSLLPIVTRILFSLPLLVISGSLLIESHFGIPGVGRITFAAITSGDQPVLMAVVGLSALLFVLTVTVADLLCRLVDPRVGQR
jgi:peptide/nickel transport system permease protein